MGLLPQRAGQGAGGGQEQKGGFGRSWAVRTASSEATRDTEPRPPAPPPPFPVSVPSGVAGSGLQSERGAYLWPRFTQSSH